MYSLIGSNPATDFIPPQFPERKTMVEQKNFPYYQAEDPKNLLNRASLMLTHEQILITCSALRLLDEYVSTKNPLKKLSFNPHITQHERDQIEAVHNACINCAISQEAHARTKDREP